MQRLSTTVVTVVGPGSDACVRSLDDARNVRVIQAALGDDPAARAMATWSEACRSRTLYTVHDADPLEPVANAWVETFSHGRHGSYSKRGDLEIAVTEAIARWRTEAIGLPDFYLVVSPEQLDPGLRDWYLGVLHRAAPHRVVPVEADATAVRSSLSSLSHGRWWPDLTDLLDQLELALPDQPALPIEPALPGEGGLKDSASSESEGSDILL